MQKTISTLDFFDTELKGTIFMTRLTKYEKETIILTNEEDDFWNVFTYNKGLQRRFISFAEQYPENCRFKSQNNEGGMTFEIEKGRLSVRLTAPYSEERRKASSEYAKKYRLNHTGERKTLPRKTLMNANNLSKRVEKSRRCDKMNVIVL